MKPSGPGLLFAGRFLITVLISLLVMDLLRSPLQYSCLENPMDRGAWQLESMVLKKMDMTQQLNNNMLHLSGSKNITMLVQPSSVDFQNAFII